MAWRSSAADFLLQWSSELGFLFNRTGSMVLGFSADDHSVLERLMQNGRANGVPKLEVVGP